MGSINKNICSVYLYKNKVTNTNQWNIKFVMISSGNKYVTKF